MGISERELRYRERQRDKGLKHIRVWVPADCVDELKEVARKMREGEKR